MLLEERIHIQVSDFEEWALYDRQVGRKGVPTGSAVYAWFDPQHPDTVAEHSYVEYIGSCTRLRQRTMSAANGSSNHLHRRKAADRGLGELRWIEVEHALAGLIEHRLVGMLNPPGNTLLRRSDTRECCACMETLPPESFSGTSTRCKTCSSEYQRAIREKYKATWAERYAVSGKRMLWCSYHQTHHLGAIFGKSVGSVSGRAPSCPEGERARMLRYRVSRAKNA